MFSPFPVVVAVDFYQFYCGVFPGALSVFVADASVTFAKFHVNAPKFSGWAGSVTMKNLCLILGLGLLRL